MGRNQENHRVSCEAGLMKSSVRSAADFEKIVKGFGAFPNKFFASVYALALLASL